MTIEQTRKLRQAVRIDGAYGNVALMALLFETGVPQLDPPASPSPSASEP